MNLIYCLHIHQSTGPDYTWEYQVNEVEAIKPDQIICFCMEEYQPIRVFGEFFERIQPWLKANNKKIICIVPSLYNFEYENVIFDDSVGYYLYSKIAYDKGLSFIKTYGLGDRTRLFSCYNHHGKWERGLMLDHLARYNLIADNCISLNMPIYDNEQTGEKFRWQYYDGSIIKIEPDFSLYTAGTRFSPWDIPPNICESFMDIVNESTVEPLNFFMTEKTVKSIACFKPFLVLSCANFHKHINEKYGFKYYDQLFDYSFDELDSVEQRIEGIIDNVLELKTRLAKKGKDSVFEQIKPTLEYNKTRFLENLNSYELMVPKSIKNILTQDNFKFYFHNTESHRSTIAIINHMLLKNWLTADRVEYILADS